jgi:predicted GNAT superfamily acetyltransferase
MTETTAVSETSSIAIRDLENESQMRAVEELQKEIWGIPDLDVVPFTHLVAAKAAGGVLIGAFDDEALIGFCYGFPSYEYGQMAHHSHMLAVKPAYRNFNLGYQLKLAQRDRVLAQGISLMTWTYDPLQSLNAYFNFSKLGVLSDRYYINFYGEDAPSFLHQNGTDRLWVRWLLTGERVTRRLDDLRLQHEFERLVPMVRVSQDELPERSAIAESLSDEHALIEIPADINSLQKREGQVALAWREATRWAFTEALSAGYLIEDFHRRSRDGLQFGSYLLSRGKRLGDF